MHRVLPRSEGAERARRAAIIGKFLQGVRWDDDLLDEKGELIGDCLELPPVESDRALSVEQLAKSSVAGRAEADAVNGSTTSITTDEEARRFFEKKRAFFDMVFVELHSFTLEEARALKDELLLWFLRFCRRERGWARQPRSILFAAACQLARQYRKFKAEAGETSIERGERIETIGFIVSVMDRTSSVGSANRSWLQRPSHRPSPRPRRRIRY